MIGRGIILFVFEVFRDFSYLVLGFQKFRRDVGIELSSGSFADYIHSLLKGERLLVREICAFFR